MPMIQVESKWIFTTIVGVVIMLIAWLGKGYVGQILDNQTAMQKDIKELVTNVNNIEKEMIRATGVDASVLEDIDDLEEEVEKIKEKLE